MTPHPPVPIPCPKRGDARVTPYTAFRAARPSPDLVVEHPVSDRRTGGNHVPASITQLRRTRRLALIAAALLLSAIVAIPASGLALAQSPPPADDISLVNRDRQLVERKKEGDFVARPIFSRQVSVLYYAIRHPDTATG